MSIGGPFPQNLDLKDLKDKDPDYWKGEVFAYVGLPQNLKDLKDKDLCSPFYVKGVSWGHVGRN